MNFELLARQIYAELGENNVVDYAVCMTRLRVCLKDLNLVDLVKLQSIPHILGVVKSGEDGVQIVLGPGVVNQVANHFQEIFKNNLTQFNHETNLITNTFKDSLAKKNATPFKLFLKKLANVFVPIIPAFIGCGLLLGITNLLAKLIPQINGVGFLDTTLGAVLALIGSGVFWGLNLFVGINTAKEFGATPVLGGVLASILTMPSLSQINIFGEAASPGRGGVIGVLFVVIFAAYLERFLRKKIPVSLDLFLTPTLVLLIAGLVALFILQPLGGMFSDLISLGVKYALDFGGPMVGFILSACFLPLVMTGLHQGLIPLHAQLISVTGVTVLLPVLAMSGAAQVGATLAILFKSKNTKLCHIIKSSIIVGFLGIGEPLIYGVTLPLFRPFVAACIGGGIAGAFIAYFKLGATGVGISGIPLILLIQNGMFLYLCGLLIAYLSGFLITLGLGFDDSIFE